METILKMEKSQIEWIHSNLKNRLECNEYEKLSINHQYFYNEICDYRNDDLENMYYQKLSLNTLFKLKEDLNVTESIIKESYEIYLEYIINSKKLKRLVKNYYHSYFDFLYWNTELYNKVERNSFSSPINDKCKNFYSHKFFDKEWNRKYTDNTLTQLSELMEKVKIENVKLIKMFDLEGKYVNHIPKHFVNFQLDFKYSNLDRVQSRFEKVKSYLNCFKRKYYNVISKRDNLSINYI